MGLLMVGISGCSAGPSVRMLHAAKVNAELSRAYLARGQIAKSKAKLLLAQSQAPDSEVVDRGFALFYAQTGRFKRARQYYVRLLKRNTPDPKTWEAYGDFLCARETIKEAIHAYHSAYRSPRILNAAEPLIAAGRCLLSVGLTKSACAHLNLALKIDRKLVSTHRSLYDRACITIPVGGEPRKNGHTTDQSDDQARV